MKYLLTIIIGLIILISAVFYFSFPHIFFQKHLFKASLVPTVLNQESKEEKPQLNSEAPEETENILLKENQKQLNKLLEEIKILEKKISQLTKEKDKKETVVKKEEEIKKERKSNLSWQANTELTNGAKEENSTTSYLGLPISKKQENKSNNDQRSESREKNNDSENNEPTQSQPQISLSYPKNNPVNKEIEISFSGSNLKSALYDLKISILESSEESEQERTISQIYDGQKWLSSYNYLKGVFSGTSFQEKFKLKIKEEKQNFKGEADIFARIRENGKTTIYAEFKGKINITDSEISTSSTTAEPVSPSATISPDHVLITEVQAADKEEFVKLYNPLAEPIDMSQWYFSYFPTSQDEQGNPKYDWNNPYRNKKFSEAPSPIIPSKGYFLIGLGYSNSDWQAYNSSQLSEEGGTIGIFSCDPKQAETPDSAKSCKIDLIAWQKENSPEPKVFETAPFSFNQKDKPFQRKKNSEGLYIDSDNNSLDFEIKE